MDTCQQRYTHDETIGIYKEAGDRDARKYFGDRYVRGLRDKDIIDDLVLKADRYELKRNPNYDRLIKELNKRGRQVGGLINGRKGERETAEALSRLRVNHRIVEGANICHEGRRAEIDFVVITPKYVYPIESKYSTTNRVIDESGVMRGDGSDNCRPYSVGDKMRSKESVLGGILAESVGDLVTDESMHSMLVFANDGIEWEDRFGRYPICSCGNLAYTIECDEGDEAFTDEQMDQIEAAIRQASTEAKYPLGVDLSAIESGLDSVIEQIAEKESKADDSAAVDNTVSRNNSRKEADASDNADAVTWHFDWKSGLIVAPFALAIGFGAAKFPTISKKLLKLVTALA